jgi:hypothetical protein
MPIETAAMRFPSKPFPNLRPSKMMAVPVTIGDRFQAGVPKALFEMTHL